MCSKEEREMEVTEENKEELRKEKEENKEN